MQLGSVEHKLSPTGTVDVGSKFKLSARELSEYSFWQLVAVARVFIGYLLCLVVGH